MPKRKRTSGFTKTRKRRTGKRCRRKYRRARYPRYRGLPAIRTRAKVRFRYSDYDHKITSTSGVLNAHAFCANGCYDPDVTGGGHQPFGWDQWSPYFRQYIVTGSKIKCYVTTDGTVNGTCGIYLDDDNTVPSNIGAMIEAKRGSFSIINQQRSSAKIRAAFSARKFYNVRDVKDNIDRIGANVSTNPADKSYFVVWFQAEAGSTASIYFIVVIDYIVDFSQPITVDQS